MKALYLLFLAPLFLLLTGCNMGDILGNIPGTESTISLALLGVLGPVFSRIFGGLIKKMPRVGLVPLEMAIGSIVATLTALVTASGDWGLPAIGAVVVSAVLTTLIKVFNDAKVAIAAAANNSPVPTVSDAKVYVPKGAIETGAGLGTAANGRQVSVTGFSPWSK